MGAYVVVGDEEILDEVVEGTEAEQVSPYHLSSPCAMAVLFKLVEEAVLSGALGDTDSIDGVMLEDANTSTGTATSIEDTENRRKARLKRMMQVRHTTISDVFPNVI